MRMNAMRVPHLLVEVELDRLRRVGGEAEQRDRARRDAEVAREPIRRCEAQIVGLYLVRERAKVHRLGARRDKQQVTAAPLVAQEQILRVHGPRVGNGTLGFFTRVDGRVIVPLGCYAKVCEQRVEFGCVHATVRASGARGSRSLAVVRSLTTEMCARDSGIRAGHQFQCPANRSSAGPIARRTTVASSSTATASANPRTLIMRNWPSVKAA